MEDSWRLILIMVAILLIKQAGEVVLKKYPLILHILSGEQQRQRITDGVADGTIHRLPRGTYKHVRTQQTLSTYVRSRSSWIRWSDGDYYLKRPSETVTVEWNSVQFSLESARVRIEPGYVVASDRDAEYQNYLTSSEWLARRSAALERANHRCQVCNSARALQVHHRTYQNIFHEQPEDLTALCRECHTLFHREGRLRKH